MELSLTQAVLSKYKQRCVLTCPDPGGAQMVRRVQLRVVESCEHKHTITAHLTYI